MNRRWGLVIAGFLSLALLITVWALPRRAKLETQAHSPKSVETSSVTKFKTIPKAEADKQPNNILLPNEPMFEPDAELEILTMEAELELVTPLEKEAVQYAHVTVNMSIEQMANLQKLRKRSTVRGADGQLKLPYAKEEVCNAKGVCKTVITNTRAGKIVWNGSWVKGYITTGVGQEVVKTGEK